MTKCQGWVNPSDINFGPQIDSLSGYQSPAGSNTLVSINGRHFFSYSTIHFGTYTPSVYFINSYILQFYVPSTLGSGTFSVQVFNGSIASNEVSYTIDNASGYWLLDSNGNISNTNASGISCNWMSRGIPVILDASYSSIETPYSVPNNVNWIIGSAANDCFISLPTGSQYSGRELIVKSMGGSVYNLESNIYGLDGTLTDTLVSSIGEWVSIVFDGSSDVWYAMQGNGNAIADAN
jgi:hypothetical protein